jgi:hypothetical protein
MSTVIGIMGRKRAGKNEFADALAASSSGESVHVFAFADAIRDIMYAVDPIIGYEDGEFIRYATVVDEHGYEAAKEYPEFRQFAQRLGTEGGRAVFGENVWVDLVMRKVAELPDDALVLIPDVRFPNEYDAIKGTGGYVVRVDRPSLVEDEHDAHASETEWLGLEPDTVVRNEGALSDLRLKAHVLLEAVGFFD